MSSSSSNKVAYFAAVTVPSLCVLGSQVIGDAPRSVQAHDEVAFLIPAQMFSVASVGSEIEAFTEKSITSPFYFDEIEPYMEEVQVVDTFVPRARPATPESLPAVRVTSILPHPKNPLAIIDGKPRRVGDTLDSGWTVMSINGKDFSVSLRHTTGKEIREGLNKN